MKKIFKNIIATALLLHTTVQADDHGNTLQTATTITQQDTPGVLNTTTDQDWFKLEVTQPGIHWFYSTGSINTRFTLYGASGNQIGTTSSGGAGQNFEYSRVLESGTYHMKITGEGSINNIGNYTFHIRSHRFSKTLDTTAQPDQLQIHGEIILYRFTAPADGTHWIYSTGTANLRATLYDHHSSSIITTASGGFDQNFLIRRTLVAGNNYYLMIRSATTAPAIGSFQISTRHDANASHWNSRSISSNIPQNGDLQLYRIDISKTGRTWIYSTGTTDLRATLYDENWNTVVTTGSGGAGDNFLIERILPGGRYRILVESGTSNPNTGAYTLHLKQPATATPIFSSGSSNHSISPLGDHDLFVFNTSGGNVTLSSSGTTNTRGTLYNSDGNSIVTTSSGGTGNNFQISRSLIAGTYYLLVKGSTTNTNQGNYQLNATFPSGTSITTLEIPENQESQTVQNLTILTNGNWTLTNLPNWITPSKTTGTGNADISFTLAPNTTGATREATILIAGIPHTIVQQAADTNPGSAPPTLAIYPAVILAIETTLGKRYRIETSQNLTTWQDTGIEFIGNGQEMTTAIQRTQSHAYFRAVID